MDPVTILSIVSAATNLGFKVASAIHALHTAAERFRAAELSILSLVEECSTIELAWDQIRAYVQSELAPLPENEQIVHRIQRSLYAGELVIAALQEDLEAALSVPIKSGFLQRTKVVWKEETLKDHQFRIRGQVGALTLLLQVLRLPRQPQREHLLTVKSRVFDDSDASAYSIVPSVRDAGSICSRATTSTSASEDIRYVPFDFEDSLFTSWVYKRNFRTPLVEHSTTSRFRLGSGRRSITSPGAGDRRGDSTPRGSLSIRRVNTDGQSIVGVSPSNDSSDAFSFATSSGSSTSQGSYRTKRSLASPITPADSGRGSFSLSPRSPTGPEDAEKLTKLFEVMGLPKDQAERRESKSKQKQKAKEE